MICFSKSKGDAASTRQRAFGFLAVAQARGWQTDFLHVPAYPLWKLSPGRLVLFLQYWKALRAADRQTIVVLQRPRRCPELLWLLSLLRRRIGYVISDFDDAIWVHSPTDVRRILRLSDEVWCGSRVILEYVHSTGANAIFVPTTIQTKAFNRPLVEQPLPVVGWIGDGAAHQESLEHFAQLLAEIREQLPPFRLRLVGVRACRAALQTAFDFMRASVDLIDWMEPMQVPEVISTFSVGIMPLLPNAFNEGKSGLKLIEYLAAGIPVVASDIGENRSIVCPPQHGFLATEAGEWQQSLRALLEDAPLRQRMGAAGQAFVRENYDRESVYMVQLERLEMSLAGKRAAAAASR